MLDCKQVATTLSSGEHETAGLGRRLSLWFHMAMCMNCRAYARQIRGLGVAARNLMRRRGANAESLSRLEEQLVERCRESAATERTEP